jgi:hypothetical protein
MRTMVLLLAIGCWGGAVLAAECCSIQHADQKNACLARQRPTRRI